MQNVQQISAMELRERLANGVVKFYFQKKDGSLREALGTTQLVAIPTEQHPQGVRQSPPSVVTFFDIEKQGWRCTRIQAQLWA